MEKSAHSAVDLMQQFFSIGSEEYDEPGIFHVLFGYPNASLAIDIQQVTSDFSLAYKVIATVVHVTIFVCGTVGNILLIAVALCTKSLQTPTYRYLVSLAAADLLVLISAIPEAVVFHHLGRRWTADQAACSLFIFVNFLGINAGSLSILAFTIEIYVAICRPFIARRFSTIPQTNKIILGIWFFSIVYCSPWLGLTEVKPDDHSGDRQQCDFRLSKEYYFYYFAADLCLFYIAPLIIALFIYTKIVSVLYKSLQAFREDHRISEIEARDPKHLDPTETPGAVTSLLVRAGVVPNNTEQMKRRHSATERMHTRAHVLRMLIVIVVLFAISWLPYRGLLVFNTFLNKHWLNLWYMFFAKTVIYLNSAMNPFLYSAMSHRFRRALFLTLSCKTRELRESTDGTAPRLLPEGIESETVYNAEVEKEAHECPLPANNPLSDTAV